MSNGIRNLGLSFAGVGLLAAGGALMFWLIQSRGHAILTFDECVDAGFLTMDAHQEICRTPDGEVFIDTTRSTTLVGRKDITILHPSSQGGMVSSPSNTAAESSARGIYTLRNDSNTRTVFYGYVDTRWLQDSVFPVYILDAEGREIGRAHAQSSGAAGDGAQTSFVVELPPLIGGTATGSLVFSPADSEQPSYSSPTPNMGTSPDEDARVVVPVQFASTASSSPSEDPLPLYGSFNLYFINETFTLPTGQQCNLLFTTSRSAAPTTSLHTIALAAINALLDGPTSAEMTGGYRTALGANTAVVKLSVADGVAEIDFSESLDDEASGSCDYLRIKNQITRTLRQFEGINEVVISIGGTPIAF